MIVIKKRREGELPVLLPVRQGLDHHPQHHPLQPGLPVREHRAADLLGVSGNFASKRIAIFPVFVYDCHKETQGGRRMGLTVLIADDETMPRMVLREHLPWAELGVTEIVEASDGDETVEQARACRPDILIRQ